MAENFSNDFQTTLSAAIADGVVTAISVVSGTGAPAVNFRIRVGNEYMLVTNTGAGTNWTVTRGVEGSTAAAHVSGTVVAHVVTTGGFQQYITEQLASYSPVGHSHAFADLTSAPTTLGGYGITDAYVKVALTAGSVVFAGTGDVLAQDNSGLFYDNANNRLGVRNAAPAQALHIGDGVQAGSVFIRMQAAGANSSGFEWINGSGTYNWLINSTRDITLTDVTVGPGRFVVDNAGRVGIGDYYGPSNYPQAKLAVQGALAVGFATATVLPGIGSGAAFNGGLQIYNTVTDASNYMRAAVQTGADYVEFAAETAGTGADNLDVRLTPTGTGRVRFGSFTAAGAEAFNGTVEIKDAGGTTRKVAVFA